MVKLIKLYTLTICCSLHICQLYLNKAAFKKMKCALFWFSSVSLWPNTAAGSKVSVVLACDVGREFHLIGSLLVNMSPELQLLGSYKNEIWGFP